MKPTSRRWFRNLLLSSIYTIGVFGILASGDGDNDVIRDFTCGLSVLGIAPVGDGTVWVGVFAKTNTDTEDRVVLLGDDGVEQFSFPIGNGGSENAVRALARDNTGDVYIGGDFGGGILRLNDDGTPDDMGFNNQVVAGFNDRVTSIIPLVNGQVYVGGFFSSYNGVIVSGLVRLNNDGTRDGVFVATVQSVESVALASDGTTDLYSGGLLPLRLERWDSNGDDIVNFDPTFDGSVLTVEPIPAPMGDIYVGGSFTDRMVRLNSNDTVDTDFDVGTGGVGTGFDDDVLSIELAADMTTDIYVGGSFTSYKGNSANGILRLDELGSPNVNFTIGSGFTNPDGLFPSSLVASVVQDTNLSPNVLDVFVGGGFTQYNGIASNGIVRLDPDGSLDAAFDVSINIDGEVCDSQTIPD